MKYEDFVDVMVCLVQDRMKDVVIGKQEVQKVNCSYIGLSCKKRDGIVAAVVDVRDLYDKYYAGSNGLSEIAGEIIDRVKESCENMPGLNMREFVVWDNVKDKVIMQLVPVEKNRGFLEDVPHRMVWDLALIYRVDIGTGTVVIKNALMEQYGVSEEELFNTAMKNMKPVLKNMAEALGVDIESPLWVGSVEGGLYGAACVLNREFMENVEKVLGEKFWILPSSVHEMLFIKDDGEYNEYALEMMVRGVNSTEVSDTDYLSDSVYHYDKGDVTGGSIEE